MISWMQRHNKYLVITIWVATIAFIGAGAVGWGSMHFGTRASSIAKVGDVAISKLKYQYTYSNLYNQYAQKFGKNFDREIAKKLGLTRIVYQNLITQALFLNLAKEYGIVVSDEEVAKEIASYPYFKDKNGNFDKTIYETFLRNQGLKPKEFEAILRDDLTVKKLFTLLNVKPLDFEKEVVKSSFLIGDKIKYAIITKNDVNVSVNEDKLKEFWQKHKLDFLTPKKFTVALHWTKANDINFSEKELKSYYEQNSFEFTDKNGKVLAFDKVKEKVKNALILKKLKTQAAVERARFKKGKIQADEEKIVAINDTIFPKEVWQKILSAKEGDVLRPQAIKNSYVTIKLEKVLNPKPMSYKEAKELVEKEYLKQKQKKAMLAKAKEYLQDDKKLTLSSKEYLSLSSFSILDKLTPQESLKVTKKIFANSHKNGTIALKDAIIAYKIVDQKLLDKKSSLVQDKEIENIKSSELTQNLIQELSKKYKIESFVKDLQ